MSLVKIGRNGQVPIRGWTSCVVSVRENRGRGGLFPTLFFSIETFDMFSFVFTPLSDGNWEKFPFYQKYNYRQNEEEELSH